MTENAMVKTKKTRRVWRYQWVNKKSVNQRTENTMAKRKRINNDLQIIHIEIRPGPGCSSFDYVLT